LHSSVVQKIDCAFYPWNITGEKLGDNPIHSQKISKRMIRVHMYIGRNISGKNCFRRDFQYSMKTSSAQFFFWKRNKEEKIRFFGSLEANTIECVTSLVEQFEMSIVRIVDCSNC
jgi:hypothetical protein